MMFRWINKRQECKSFEIDVITIKKSMTEYHHLINSQAYFTQQYMGGNEYVKLVNCLILLF